MAGGAEGQFPNANTTLSAAKQRPLRREIIAPFSSDCTPTTSSVKRSSRTSLGAVASASAKTD